jgi:hypothetical protein
MSDYTFDNRVGSEIFSAVTYNACEIYFAPHMDDSCIGTLPDNDLEKSVYIIKHNDKSFIESHKNYCLDNEIAERNFAKSTIIQKFLIEHPEYLDKSINEICYAAGGAPLLHSIITFKHISQQQGSRLEAKLNKHNGIYPELQPITTS